MKADDLSADKVLELFKTAVIRSVNTQLFIPRHDQVEVVMVDTAQNDSTQHSHDFTFTVTFAGTKDVGPMKGSSTNLAKIFKSQLDHFGDKDLANSQLSPAMHKSMLLASYTVTSPANWLQEQGDDKAPPGIPVATRPASVSSSLGF
eukprot:Tamp_08096.p2 GENE.Tamp_08096~~Tamp_08096.p2  ORF type:complete len:147 (+),score=31.42 Tamp_08096:1666-2106(+)